MKEFLERQRKSSFQKSIEKADRRRQGLLRAGELSVPTGMGKLAIVVSKAANKAYLGQPGKPEFLTASEQREVFMEEAKRLSSERVDGHRYGVLLRPKAVSGDIKMLFMDPEVTDMIFIGHGSISDIWTDEGSHFDWRSAAKAANHLKTGQIEQRICGHFPLSEHRNVPLGTFAVSHLENVIAAVGEKIPDAHPNDELFGRAYVPAESPLEQIAAMNIKFADQADPKK